MKPWEMVRRFGQPASGGGDPYWANVVSLLNFPGANGSTTFTDQKGKIWTPAGNAQISTAQSKYGGAAALFDGSGDYISTPSHSDFAFGTGDFTIEGWIYLVGDSAPNSSGLRNAAIATAGTQATANLNYWWLSVDGNSTTTGTALSLYVIVAGSSFQVTAPTAISKNAWHHYAACRASGISDLYLDGSKLTKSTNTLTTQNIAPASNPLVIAASLATGYESQMNGYIDDSRITKGVARYTSNFTPPAAAFPNF